MDTIRAFLSKIRTLFIIFKKGREVSPLPTSCIPGVWLNVHLHTWISLNILENAWINCSDYARALNINDHLTCLTGFWRCLGSKPGFWLCNGCICKGYEVFWICLIMAPYPSLCLNITEYCWMTLNMPEKIVLTMPGFSICCNIVIITLSLL